MQCSITLQSVNPFASEKSLASFLTDGRIRIWLLHSFSSGNGLDSSVTFGLLIGVFVVYADIAGKANYFGTGSASQGAFLNF